MKMEELNDDLDLNTNWATQSLDTRSTGDNLLEDILINSALNSASRPSRVERRGNMSEEKHHKQDKTDLLSKHERLLMENKKNKSNYDESELQDDIADLDEAEVDSTEDFRANMKVD